MLEVVSYSFGGIPLLSLAGDFDHSGLPEFREKAGDALAAGARDSCCNSPTLCYIDSGGVSTLLRFAQLRNHGWLGVIGPSPDVLRLLQMVGLTIDPSFSVFSGLDEVEEFLSRVPASPTPHALPPVLPASRRGR